MNDKPQETRYAAFVLVWTEAGQAQRLAKEASRLSVGPNRGHDEIVASARWAAPVRRQGHDSPDVIVGVSATDKKAIAELVEEISHLLGVRNPQDPQVVHLSPRYKDGRERPHNGWP